MPRLASPIGTDATIGAPQQEQRRLHAALAGTRGLAEISGQHLVAKVRPGAQVVDSIAADILLEHMPKTDILHGDKSYDSDALRRKIENRGAVPNIPPKTNRRWKNCFSPYLYRGRNAIERMFGRLKDFRRIATRYDRLAINYLAAVGLAATVCYWL